MSRQMVVGKEVPPKINEIKGRDSAKLKRSPGESAENPSDCRTGYCPDLARLADDGGRA